MLNSAAEDAAGPARQHPSPGPNRSRKGPPPAGLPRRSGSSQPSPPPPSPSPLPEQAPRGPGTARAPRAAPLNSRPESVADSVRGKVGIAAPAGISGEQQRLTFPLNYFPHLLQIVCGNNNIYTCMVLPHVHLFFVSPQEQMSVRNLGFQRDPQRRERGTY